MFHSQIGQDIFVNHILNIDNGFFLDIGAGTSKVNMYGPQYLSNTYFFEKQRNWNGICLDFDEEYIALAKENRSSNCICVDLEKENINTILTSNNCPKLIDYISFDVDSASQSVLNIFDFHKYKFKIMTFEHNLYSIMNTATEGNYFITDKIIKDVIELYYSSREIMNNYGYKILCGNVILPNFGRIEDWYINPEYIDEKEFDYLKCDSTSVNDIIQKIITKQKN